MSLAFAKARFQHIPTQSCCMLSFFRIGSLGRGSKFKHWHVHWHQHSSTNASSSQSFAVRDSALCVCSLRLCKALPTGCSIFSRGVLAHYSNTEPVRLRAAGMKPLLLGSGICTGLQCRSRAFHIVCRAGFGAVSQHCPDFSRQRAFVTACR